MFPYISCKSVPQTKITQLAIMPPPTSNKSPGNYLEIPFYNFLPLIIIVHCQTPLAIIRNLPFAQKMSTASKISTSNGFIFVFNISAVAFN